MTIPNESNIREYIRRVCMAMDYISARLAENPTLDEIAEAASFSKFHFHRVFKGVTGETVAEFTRRLRLERSAQHLLFDMNRDVTDIAFGVGFSSSQNFATAFRKHFNQSPSEFRASHAAEQESKKSNATSNDSNAENASAKYLSTWINQQWPEFERSQTMNVEVKDLPAYHVAYARHLGPYGEEGSSKAFGRLMQWAGPRGFAMGGRMIGICWDSPELTPPEKVRYDACITVPEGTQTTGDIGTQTVPGGKYAVYHAEVTTEEFGGLWNRMMCEWLPQSGYQPDDRPGYEVYYNHADMHPERKWIVDVCVPVKPL